MNVLSNYNFNMEQYLSSINLKLNGKAESDTSTTYNAADSYSEDGTKVFDFKSAFEIYGDSKNAINNDILSEVITGLSNALEIDTIRNIDKFIESFDLSKVPDDSVAKNKRSY